MKRVYRFALLLGALSVSFVRVRTGDKDVLSSIDTSVRNGWVTYTPE